MRTYLKDNLQFILLMFTWVLVGAYGGVLIYFVLPVTVFLFRKREMYAELLISFLFILVLSDSRQDNMAFAESIKNLYIVLLALFFLFDLKSFFPLNRIFQKFTFFFIVAIVCLFFTETFLTSFQKTLSYFLVLIVVTNLVYKLIREDPEAFFLKFIYFMVLILITGLVLKYTRPFIVTLEGRYTGILGNPNGLGVFCFLFFMLYTVILDSYPLLFSRVEKGLIFFSVLASIILCGSRSALFSIIIFSMFRYFYRISPFFGFITFLIVLVVYQYVSTNLVNIVIFLGLQDYFRIDTLEDGSGRLVAWRFAWENIQKNVFLGKGFAYTEYLYRKNYVMLSQQGHQGNAHNSFLTFWLDTGLVGLLSYLYAFVSSFLRAAKKSSMATPALYALLFSANFESWLTGSLNPMTIQVWILLTLLTCLKEIVEEREQNREMKSIT